MHLSIWSRRATTRSTPRFTALSTGQQVTILLGSANLTGGGLHSNIELSLLYSTDVLSPVFQKFKTWLANTQTLARVTELDEFAIGSYQVKHDIYRKLARLAERKALDEINRQYTLDSALLQQYAKEYMANQPEQNSWAEKQSNYRRAKEVLDGMISTPPASRAEFLAAYGQLVGAAGSDHLFHSGSIHRSINTVADEYSSFLVMLQVLRSAIGGEPHDVFQLGMSHAKPIKGLGPNVLTEIMNTYAPSLYAVLNRNPIGSLRKMNIALFGDPGSFQPKMYADYTDLMKNIAARCGFDNLSQVDHFMNYVYWKYVVGAPPHASGRLRPTTPELSG